VAKNEMVPNEDVVYVLQILEAIRESLATGLPVMMK